MVCLCLRLVCEFPDRPVAELTSMIVRADESGSSFLVVDLFVKRLTPNVKGRSNKVAHARALGEHTRFGSLFNPMTQCHF